jgi:MFS family permease
MPSPISYLLGEQGDVLEDKDFQLLLLASSISPLGLVLMSPILETLTGVFGATEASIGLLMAFYTAPAIVVIPIAGMLSDKFGRKLILLSGLLLIGVSGPAISLTTDYTLVLALRFLQGIGAAATTPIIVTTIGDLYRDSREATAQGLRFATGGLINVIGPLVAGVIVTVSWRYPFILYFLAIPVAAILFRTFEEPTDRPTTEDVTPIDDDDTVAEVGVVTILSQPRAQALLFVRGLPSAIWIGFLTYNSLIVVRFLGGTATIAGLLAATGSVAFTLAATQTGRITSVFSSRFVPLLVGNLLLGVGYGIFALAPTVIVAGLGIGFAGIGFGFTVAIYRSVITSLAPTQARGTIVGLAESMGRMVTTLTPVVMGFAVSTISPTFGLELAIQITSLSVAVIASVGGIVGLLIARMASPIIVA